MISERWLEFGTIVRALVEEFGSILSELVGTDMWDGFTLLFVRGLILDRWVEFGSTRFDRAVGVGRALERGSILSG